MLKDIFKKDFNSLNDIKEIILDRNKDRLEWISITSVGMTYVVRIEERILDEIKKENKYCNIYSNKEANVLFNNAKIKSESISPIPKNDLIMQHEELRRKLQDSYILQHQLLSAENERLRQEISEIEAKLAIARSEHDKKIAYQKASPKFKLHVVPVDMPEDELITYQLKTSTGKILNPVGEKIINNLIWGEHIFSSPKYSFELADHVDGISIEIKDDTCLLILSDKIKSAQTIKILIREREA